MKKDIICTVCPRGCNIVVEGEGNEVKSVEGYGCKRGITYATNEFISPVRILTTLVKIDGVENELLPVRSNNPIPKAKIFDCMYTGMAKNDYGWWYMKNGKLNTSYTGVGINAYGWWYMKNGKLDLTYTGTVKYNGQNYAVINGAIVR